MDRHTTQSSDWYTTLVILITSPTGYSGAVMGGKDHKHCWIAIAQRAVHTTPNSERNAVPTCLDCNILCGTTALQLSGDCVQVRLEIPGKTLDETPLKLAACFLYLTP